MRRSRTSGGRLTIPRRPACRKDSVFAQEGVTVNNRGGRKQFHNEYVVFGKAQVYPEYVIWYTL